ncbi:MAG: hypothetical protein P1V18_02060 [Candidatus Gracilibacteria bacterium]|nr:hypothetical protein [Candidatus Gracilibacteria bacterium]
MSRKNTISRNFRRLAAEKKVILFSASLTLISCFMPWYGSNSRLLINRIDWNAFDNIGSIGGYLISSFAIITLALVVAPMVFEGINLTKKLPFRESSIVLFLSGQSAFISFLFTAIYSQYALVQSANSSTRFGLYMALSSSLITAVAALTMMQKEKRLPQRVQEEVEMEIEDIDNDSFTEDGEYVKQEDVAETELEHRPLQTQPGWGDDAEVLEETTTYSSPISEAKYQDQYQENQLVETFQTSPKWDGAEASSSIKPKTTSGSLSEDTVDF